MRIMTSLSTREVSELVWPVVEKHQREAEAVLCEGIESKMRRQEAIYGIEGMLRKMDEAYEMHLLVEKGYISSEDGAIVLITKF